MNWIKTLELLKQLVESFYKKVRKLLVTEHSLTNISNDEVCGFQVVDKVA